MKELQLNEKGQPFFIHQGIEITDPTISTCGRFPMPLEDYGFEIWSTGGGCTAHVQQFTMDGKTILMLLTDDNLCHVDIESKLITGGLFDEEMDNCFLNLTFERG
jgi:hypothetical protein